MADESKPTETSTAPKPRKMGCGGMIMFLIVLVILFGFGLNTAFGYYARHCVDEDIIECLMNRTDDDQPAEGSVYATGTYTYKDYSAVLTLYIPLDGGTVTGNVTGECDASVDGAFSGNDSGVIEGTIVGTCSPFVINIPASAEFSGIVDKTNKTVSISFTGKSAGITHKDSMSLSY